jgi:methylisocitrate lyase
VFRLYHLICLFLFLNSVLPNLDESFHSIFFIVCPALSRSKMTLMTATDSQMNQAMYDLGVWQKLPPSPALSQSTRMSTDQHHDIDSGDITPFHEAGFTVDCTPSGNITPSEAITPPSGIETMVDVASIEESRFLTGIDTPPLLSNVEPPVKTFAKPATDLLDVRHEEATSGKPLVKTAPEVQVVNTVTPITETTSTSAVRIRAPLAYDPNAPASTRLRHMIKNLGHILVCPGVYDGLSARIALDVGFEGMYMTGAGTNASRLGMADLGIAHLHDMRTNAEMIANLKPDGPPVIADMDTGYGGPMVIDRALQQYHLAGVAGFHIEDQVMQKRCGHLQGKEVVDTDTYISRIRACVAAAKRLRSDIVIIARTDALQSRGYDECITRLRRARDEGADMGILEGFSSKAQARQAVKDLAPWPLCLNSVENGVSPLISVDEAQAMGFRVVIFSFASLAPAYSAIKDTFQWLMEYGVTGSDVSPKTIFNVCGLQDLMVIDEQAGGNSFKKGV